MKANNNLGKFLRLSLVSGISVASITISGAAFAQSTYEASIESDGDIIVTAQRREEKLQDTPLAITAFSVSALRDRSAASLADLTASIPNIDVTSTNRPTGGGSAYAAFIRGIGSGDYAFPTDPAVGLYVDGVYIARPLGGLLNIADVSRIEVLRGPQGTLYGRNSLAGAINVVTAKAPLDGSPTGSVQVRIGNFGRIDGIGEIALPLVEGLVGAKLSVASYNMKGYAKQILTGRRLNGEGRLIVRGGLLFQPAENLSIDLRGDYGHQDQSNSITTSFANIGTPANLARFNTIAAPVQNAQLGLPVGSVYANWLSPTDYTNYAATDEYDNNERGGLSATINLSLSEAFNIQSITAWRKLSTDVQSEPDATPYTVSSVRELFRDETLSQELHFSGKVGPVRYILGGYLFEEKGDSRRFSTSFAGIYEVTGLASDARSSVNLQDYTARSQAVFGQLDIELTPGLEVTLGGRYNHDFKEFIVEQNLTQIAGVVIPRRSRTGSWNSFTPKAGINFKATDDILLYGSWSRGFKSGGFSTPSATFDAPIYLPEKLETFEAGLKAQWFDRRLTTNIALFSSKWSDIQQSVQQPAVIGGTPVIQVQNAGTAKAKGFEAELSARVSDNLSLDGSIGYTDIKLTSLTPGAIANGFTLLTQLPHSPKWTLDMGATISVPTSIGKFRLRASAAWRDDQFLTVNDARSFAPDYWVVNTRLVFEPAFLPGLELAGEIKNLTDTHYFSYRQSSPAFGNAIQKVNAPRTFAFDAIYRF